MVYLILGLGNPGPQYKLTRHNIGFMVVDTLAEKHGITLDTDGHYCRYGIGKIKGHPVLVAKPMTYMNESGLAAKAITVALDIPAYQIIVVYDENGSRHLILIRSVNMGLRLPLATCYARQSFAMAGNGFAA